MIVRHNLLAMNAQRQFGINMKSKAKSTEKLSSGYRVNRAADDAAGLAISEKMRRMIRGLNQGAENTQDGISFVQIGDGAMNEIHEMVHRMTELSIQAANDTLTEEDREYIDLEVQQLKMEINRVSNSTTFNEIPVFDNHTVVFGLEGEPNDLQIFNDAYDSSGASYGGFVFHGQRITWTQVDSNMVTTDPNTGEEVFVKGEYSYTVTDPRDGEEYNFAFHCEDGTTPPVITRDISIEADANGVIIGKERFAWSKVYDLNGNICSESNLHAGPWAVDYYGAKFTFTVPEPIDSLATMAEDIDSCKSSAVYYNWETYYSEGKTEKAVDVDSASVKLEDRRVTQAMVDTMLDYAGNGVEVTVGAGEDGIWLIDNNGQALTDSLVTWKEMGIDSWEAGTEVPGLSGGNSVRYKYADPRTAPDSTGLSFEFTLSNITSKDSVITGLNGMDLGDNPGSTLVDVNVSSNNTSGGIQNITASGNMFLNFSEQVTENRDFDVENWTMDAQSITYANNALRIDFAGGFSLSGSTVSAEKTVSEKLEDYIDELVYAKLRDKIWNTQYTTTDFVNNYVNASGNSETGNVKIEVRATDNRWETLTYTYDYSDVFTSLTDQIQITRSQENIDDAAQYFMSTYTLNADGTYSYYDVRTKCQNAADQAEADYVYDNTLTSQENADRIQAARDQAFEAEKQRIAATGITLYSFNMVYTDKNGNLVNYAAEAAGGYIGSILSDIANGTDFSVTTRTYARADLLGDEKTSDGKNIAIRPVHTSIMKETPVEPDLYIVHSSEENDRTGIPRFAMNTTALGIAFADCKTKDAAMALVAGTKRALQYVSSKRATYGALQNRMEHTYNNNRNISENLTAAESRIRDTDMAKEMVKYSKDNILEQVGQAMMAQANQSQQGVLSLLN